MAESVFTGYTDAAPFEPTIDSQRGFNEAMLVLIEAFESQLDNLAGESFGIDPNNTISAIHRLSQTYPEFFDVFKTTFDVNIPSPGITIEPVDSSVDSTVNTDMLYFDEESEIKKLHDAFIKYLRDKQVDGTYIAVAHILFSIENMIRTTQDEVARNAHIIQLRKFVDENIDQIEIYNQHRRDFINSLAA